MPQYLWDTALDIQKTGPGEYVLPELSTAGWTNVNKSGGHPEQDLFSFGR